MNQVIVFLWVVLFSASAPTGGGLAIDATLVDHEGTLWTTETCEAHESAIWGRSAESYAKSDVLFMFTECQIVIPRQVRQVK